MNPLIVALDFESPQEAMSLVERLGGAISVYKVGMELYAAAGTDVLDRLRDAGKEIFLDMKFYDIGETVKRAVAQVARKGVRFLTVHGSQTVMRAAVEGRGDSSLQLLGVTVLTSFDEQDLADLGYKCSVQELVDLRVRNAMASGVDGLICSPVEVARVRSLSGPRAVLVTPGVRSTGAATGDQKRVATPADAIQGGADFLVIGRQVTRSSNPEREVERITAELAEARSAVNS